MRRVHWRAAFLVLGLTLPVWAGRGNSLGSITVQVLDRDADVVPDASVYVYDEKDRTVGEMKSGGVLRLNEGVYELVAVFVELDGDTVRRHISPRGHVDVSAGDQASAILPLPSMGRYGDGTLPIPLAVLPQRNTLTN